MTSPSLLILGSDAVLAASPATPVQLVHACLRAGYRSVVPASWGDEILARRIIDAVENTNGAGPLVLCSCPLVARRLSRTADDIGSLTLPCVSPPVAAALYLRALYAPASVRISYAGTCPAAGHASIDAWLTPTELLTDLSAKGIHLATQPTEFDSILPPDRRRHYSEPGGVPSSDALRKARGSPELVELEPGDFAIDLAQALLAGGRRLVDVAPALGCSCSGAGDGVASRAARSRVRATEPPRAPSPVVDHDVGLGLDVVSTPERQDAVPIPAAAPRHQLTPPPAIAGHDPRGLAAPSSAATPVMTLQPDAVRRRSPPGGTSRAVIGVVPQSRSAGRHLPRAYVARRRSSPKGIRQSGVRRQVDVMGAYRDRTVPPRWIWIAGIGSVLIGVVAVLIALFGG